MVHNGGVDLDGKEHGAKNAKNRQEANGKGQTAAMSTATFFEYVRYENDRIFSHVKGLEVRLPGYWNVCLWHAQKSRSAVRGRDMHLIQERNAYVHALKL